jgi:outer membrane protein assembly factor BamD
MVRVSRAAFLIIACSAAVPMAGCAKDKGKGDTQYVARDVATLYSAAKRQMDGGNYLAAAKLFDEVERQHPYSVWARRAQLMSAFNYYIARKYPEAVSSAQRFVTIHPGNADAPYAQYLIAMSYMEQMDDVSRDQSSTVAALNAFNDLIRRYPESRYASDGREKLALLNDHLAGKEMEIGRFYQRSEQWLASTYRFREVVDKYHSTTHGAEALERLVESYLSLGLPDEAFKTASVLGANYADTYWYRQALRLLDTYQKKHGAVVEGAVVAGPVSDAGSGTDPTSYSGKSLPKPKGSKTSRPKTSPTKFPPRGTVPPPPESE